MLERPRFPRVARYLDALPGGLEAHPQALIKGALVRAAVLDRRVLHARESLPAELAAWFEQPPLATTWLRSVHAQALFLAIADDHGMTEEQFGDWTYRLQKKLYGGPLYRALAVVATPPMLLSGAQHRWTAFHRGTQLEVVVRHDARTATIVLSFPHSLYTRTNLVGFARGLQAVVELSNALTTNVALVAATSTSAKLEAWWTTR